MPKTRVFTSKNPLFSAYKKFGWDDNTWGGVIPIHILKRAAKAGEIIHLKFRGIKEEYQIDARKALEFVESNDAHMTIQVPQKAGVIPTSIMRKIYAKRKSNARNNNVQPSQTAVQNSSKA